MALLPFGYLLIFDAELHFRNSEIVICPTVSTAYGLGYSDVLAVFSPDDIVNSIHSQ